MKKALFLFALVIYLAYMAAAVVGIAKAEGDMTATPEVTEVVTTSPAPVEPPVVVTPPAESPFTPMVVMAIVVVGGLLFVIVSQNSTIKVGLVQLGASAPAFGYAGVKTGTLEGITALEGVVAKTDSKLDDAAVAEIKRIFVELFAEMDAKRSELSVNSKAAMN